MKNLSLRYLLDRRFWAPVYSFALFLVLGGLLFILQADSQPAAASEDQSHALFLPGIVKQGQTVSATAVPTSPPRPSPTPQPTNSPAPVLTPSPTNSPAPTLTATPTNQPTLTHTPLPTSTSTPIPTATSTPGTAPGCPQGMISCWKFEETGGSVYADSAGPNPAHCSGSQCPALNTGISGTALSFDGTDDMLVVPHHPTLAWGSWNSFTIETWVKVEGSCAGSKVLIGKPKDPDGLASWWLGCADGTNTAAFYVRDDQGASAVVRSQTPINDGRWHHLAAVRDQQQGNLRIYLDGKLEGIEQAVFKGNFASLQPVTLGSFGGQYAARAALDEAALYTSVLSEDLIRAHYYLARPYCQVCSTPVRIMPLGDSITVGSGPPSPYNGYRSPLYQSLTALDYDLNFVGSMIDGIENFDRDHEGHGGWHAAGHPTRSILVYVYDWLVQNPPDLVLLHIGTNDINDGGQSAGEVAAILDEIDRFDPDITVVLALIINRQSYSTATTQYNLDLRAMAEQRIQNGDKIVLVDMESALNYPEDMVDLLHPNESGYAKMAVVWKQALVEFLPVCP